MIDSVRAVKEETEMLMNSSAFSADSIEGWILIIIAICLFHSMWRRASKAVSWCLCGILLVQLLHVLSLTGFNEIVPLGNIFKYDILTAIAQCFAGTKICSVLLWFDSFLMVTFSKLWELGADFFRMVKDAFIYLFEKIKAVGDSGSA